MEDISLDARIAHIETELAVIDASQKRTEGLRKLLWGIGCALVIQLIGIAVGYGELKAQLEDIASFRKDTATVLTVLGDHGTELANLRQETARIRGKDDALQIELINLQNKMVDRTQDRYYRQDAIREIAEMREWVTLTVDAKIAKHHEGHRKGEFNYE